MYCIGCGKKIQDGAKFCINCGREIGKSENSIKTEKNLSDVQTEENGNSTKNILFEITDEKLLKDTGGIVQGMSGSPIIQDDYIIGAVTHVVVDDPSKGYGIFITKMLEEAEN